MAPPSPLRSTYAAGQVVVEVLLILPFFLLLVFTTMEIGHLAFRTIIIHHAAYEVARIGSLTATPDYPMPACQQPQLNQQAMQNVLFKILPIGASFTAAPAPTLADPQEGCMNYDVVVTVTQQVPLALPMSSMFLADKYGGAYRTITGAVRMPIERPLFR